MLANKFKICGPHRQEVTELHLHSCKIERKDGLMSGRLADCTSTFCFGQSSLTLKTAQFSATSQWEPEITQSYFLPFQSLLPVLNLLIFVTFTFLLCFISVYILHFYFDIYIFFYAFIPLYSPFTSQACVFSHQLSLFYCPVPPPASQLHLQFHLLLFYLPIPHICFYFYILVFCSVYFCILCLFLYFM